MTVTSPVPGIKIRDLAVRFADLTVFDALNFDIPARQFTALLGPSGVGKTSILRILAGLARPSAGVVTATDAAPLAGRIAYMGQQDLLFPWARVIDNVMLGARLRGTPPDPARAMDLLEKLGLANRARALPAELSGGMRQRVAIARTLYEQRPIVLMDEPFSALDSLTRARMQNRAAERRAGCTVLLITHDPQEACRLAHHLLVLSGHPARLSAPIMVAGHP
ncbi:MAG: ABC transporter ATP-binding protein, partial [Acidocella sp.]|nr:ABC transporter ATP-binding protein [Acidocella sp.]